MEIDVPETLPVISKQNGQLDNYLSMAINNRPELKGLNIRQAQSALGLKISKSDYLPSLNFGGNANYNRPEQRLFPNKAEFTPTWNAGVYLNWNVSSLYTNKQKIKESKLNINSINQALEKEKENIQIEVNTDYSDYIKAKEKINIATKEVEQATV